MMRATNQYGNVVYAGVVRDGEKTLVPYTHNFTIEETKSRNDSLTRFSAYVAQALRQGYPQSTNTTGIFYGAIGNDVNPGKSVGMSINEPDRGLTWPYHLGGMGVSGASNPNYTVVVDYMTKA